MIRVMKCCNEECPRKYHRELPDIMMPYKRYDVESIEEVIESEAEGKEEAAVGAENSTIGRWKRWFRTEGLQIMMQVVGAITEAGGTVELALLNVKRIIETIKEIIGQWKGTRSRSWLGEVVRMLVNRARWKVNGIAYLTG